MVVCRCLINNNQISAPPYYNVIGNKGYWIVFDKVTGVSIHGGTLDVQGAALWSCENGGKKCPNGATVQSLKFNDCKDITIRGLASQNSQLYHIVIDKRTNVKVQGVKITASANSPNTDTIHVQSHHKVYYQDRRRLHLSHHWYCKLVDKTCCLRTRMGSGANISVVIQLRSLHSLIFSFMLDCPDAS